MKKEIPSKKLKTVSIDAILKNGKTVEAIKAKRGRPAGSKKLLVIENATLGPSITPPIKHSVEGVPASTALPKVVIQPLYDTTEESKAFIKAPFEIFAVVTKISDLQLTLLEIEAISPSFKIVYDKRIAPNLGQHADLFAFLMVFGGIAANKISIFNKAKAKGASPHPRFETETKAPEASVENKASSPHQMPTSLFPTHTV